ncbi:MAG: type II secretion system protein [Chloroflexi bacterium]|nr:MAG: type II secretion system protein [Chloroflexota bacterium]
MELMTFFAGATAPWSPLVVAGLVVLATFLVWQGFAPARTATLPVAERLQDYLDRRDVVEESELAQPFAVRVLLPLLRRLVRGLGGLMPKRSFEKTAHLLVLAGEPGGMSVLDFMGVRLLLAVALGGGYFLLLDDALPFFAALRNTVIISAVGLLLPQMWLRRRARSRQKEILRALPDALDMLTIGVEAGLAFESALLRVGEQWQNALSQEFRRVVREMRMGAPRNEALRRMVERTDVDELSTFVAVLVQSNQLGVSIAQVLHGQAEQMRIKRRQRAEEQARQAGVKIVLVLVFFIFPVMFIVIMGPTVPRIMTLFDTMSGG